jgi:hypothetical protein
VSAAHSPEQIAAVGDAFGAIALPAPNRSGGVVALMATFWNIGAQLGLCTTVGLGVG